ncbi:hypothetical protein K0M31_002070, partial [Melipona bicolor]
LEIVAAGCWLLHGHEDDYGYGYGYDYDDSEDSDEARRRVSRLHNTQNTSASKT